MAGYIFDSLQSFVIKWLKKSVTNQLAYVYNYEKTVEELDRAVQKLQKEEKDVRDKAEEDEDKYGRERHDDIKGWLVRVEKILSEYEDFKKFEDRECLGCFLVFPNLKARFDSGKIAEDIKEKVREVQKKKEVDESRCQEGPSSMGDDAIASSSNTNNESCRQCHEAIMKLIITEYITNQLANLCNQEKNAEMEEQDKVDENLQEETDIIVRDTSQQKEYQYNESHCQGPSPMGNDVSSCSCSSSSNANVEAEEQDKVDENLQEETEIIVCDTLSQQEENQDGGKIDGGEVVSDSEHEKALEKHEDRECLGCAVVFPYLMASYHLGKITENVEEDVRERQMKKKDIDSIIKLITESINQLVYMLNPKKKVAELDNVADNLRKVRDMLCDTSQQEEGQYRREIDDGDKKWLDDVKEILFKVEDFKKREDLEWGRHFLAVPNPITRYHQGKKAEVIKLMVEQLQKETHDNRSRWRGPLSLGDVFSNVDYESFESRKKTMNDIMEALKDPRARMIGVHGSAGMGKTTLVIEAAKQARESKLFDVMIMVQVTRSPDVRKLQGQIADMLGMTLEEESEQGRAVRIKKRLKKENENTLIILDDLYAQVDMNMLGIPVENGDDGKLRNLKELGKSPTPRVHNEEIHNDDNSSQKKPIPKESKSSFPMSGGKMMEKTTLSTSSSKSKNEERHKVCKILLISEVRQVLVKQMDGKERLIFSVSNLNDKEAETLFKNMAGIDDKKSEYETVATKIARNCDGLPMTIVTTARALKNQSYSIWENIDRKLERQKQIGTPEDSTKLSYRLLENEELKITFLLCARMGQDALISDLVKFCVGLGFLQGVYTIREARDRVQTLLVTLKESGLLSDSYSTDRFTMQNLVRSAALSIASEEKHAFTLTKGKIDEWPAGDKLERYTAISLRHCHVIEKFPKSIKCPRLKVFEVENNGSQLEIPDNFFKEMKELRVLCLTGVNLKSLPSSIKFLTKLRMLCLEQCILSEGLYIIRKLKNLRILSFSRSNIERLPIQLKYLSKLQVFDVSNCSKLRVIPPNVISSLTSLEELYMRNTSIQWSVNEGHESQSENASISELGNLNQLTNLDIQIPSVAHLPKNLFFDKLYSYKIVIGSSNRYLLPGFKMPEKYELSRFLAIQQKDGFDIHSQKGIKMLFERVEDLMLEKLNGVQDIFYALNLKGFPCLKHLSIVSNSSIQSLIKPEERNLPEEAFTKLKSLHLYKLKKMKQICSCGSLSEASFAKLKVIKIKLCHELKSAFSISMVGHLIALETIEVSECNSLKEIVPVQISNANKSIDFPELRSLMLQSLSDFIGFYPTSPAPAEGTKILFHEKILLSKLEIMELSSIPINQIWAAESSPFENLIHLDVKDCGNLKYLLSFSMARNLAKLQRLFVSECDQMVYIVFQKQDSDAKEKNCIFPKLKKIKLSRMRSLSKIWKSKVPIDSIDNLDTLTIEECHKLVNVFTSNTVGTFQSLGSLMVKNCKSMEAIFDLADAKQYARYKTKLQDIHLETLPKLEHVLKWQKDQEGVLNLNNIRKIWLQDCERLENIFPFFLAKTIENLQYLVVWDCSRLREIVATGEEANNNKTISPIEFKFPELETIKFLDLPNFKSFYPRDCELSCPKLKDLSVESCDKLEPFREKYTNNQGKRILFPIVVINKLKSMQIESRHAKSSTSYGYRRDKLEELHLSRLRNIEILYSFLHHNPNLKSLWLNDCSFGMLVPLERPAKIESLGIVPKLKSLNLTNLLWLKEIGFERDTIFQRIESLILKNCPRLDMIAPSSVFFSHLTNLVVVGCDRLKYLISLRIAESLVQLNTMKVINCASLEDIVSNQVREEKNTIVFRQLKDLELVSLKNLKSFCRSKNCVFEFPSLEKFVVSACPKLKNFSKESKSTTVLEKVYTGHEKENRWCWNGNLQATIQYLFQKKKFFEGMVELSVFDQPGLEEIWQCKESLPKDWFYSLKTLKLKDCKFETYAIPSNVLRRLKSLQELEVCNCSNITFVFEMNDIKIRETPLRLKKLSLGWLYSVTHVWQQQEEEDKQGILSFKNLQQVTVTSCGKLKTLFPTALARDLKKLEKLEVMVCDELPQIVGKEKEAANWTVVFPRLTTLTLERLPMLTCFDSKRFAMGCPELDYLYVSSCDRLDTKEFFKGMDELSVSDHPELEVVWQRKQSPPKDWFYSLKTLKLMTCKFETYAIPSNVLRRLKSLQELEVSNCSSITFIFEMNDIKNKEAPLGLKKLTLRWLEDVTHVWQQEKDKQGILSFKNLQQVTVECCSKLRTLLPAVLARDLTMLEKLEVNNCGELPQIVGKEGEAADGTENVFAFPRLAYLRLSWLPKLTCFYSKRFIVECPELDYLYVRFCDELELFQSQQESHREDQGSSSNSIIRQPFFSDIKGISKVENLYLSWKDASVWLGQSKDQDLQYLSELYLDLGDYEKENFTLPSAAILEKAPNLEKMRIVDCRRLKEISLEGMLGHLKRLELRELYELHSIGVLKDLPKLQELRVFNCRRLTTLLQPSAGKMLTHLEEMYVENCESMKEIIGRGRDETATEEIKFERLERISLKDLSSLACFHPGSATLQLPSLIQVDIWRCPRMKNFSQGSRHVEPASRLIQVSFDPRDETELVFHHDLNVVVRWLPVIEQGGLVIGDYSALKGIWLGEVQIPYDLFGKLKYLVVDGCEFLSNATLPSYLLPFLNNLEELVVCKCTSVKTIFDVKDTPAKNSNMSVIPLKKLTLERLPTLRHVWNEDLKGRLSLPYLEEVIVSECETIKSLFPASVAKDNLKKLDVRKCAELVEIVAKVEAAATEEANQNLAMFPKVTLLTLWDLPKLRCICSGMSILDWPELENLDVYGCPMLTIFTTDSLSSSDSYLEEGQDHFATEKHGIVSARKVPPNLERLSLNKENVILIEQGLVPHVDLLLQNIKFLTLRGFNNDSDAFPDVFFSKAPLPSVQEFAVVHSAFEEIFPSQMPGMDYAAKSFSQLEKLELRSLDKLKSIGFEHTWMVPLLENLQHLTVLACISLTNLAPSYVSFSLLTQVNVEDCARLKYLFTTSTAESLVALEKMSITNCESLETVVVADDGEGDNPDEDVIFTNLRLLSLDKLPELGSFYMGNSTLNFPSLFSVEITQCKSMKTFSHGNVAPEELDVKINGVWHDDLNSAIRQLFEKGSSAEF